MKILKATILGLWTAGLLPACHVAHDAAVTSFRVIDAPANYVRRQIDAEGQPRTTTTTTSTTVTNPGSDVSNPGNPVTNAAAPPSAVHRQSADAAAANAAGPRSTSRDSVSQPSESGPKAGSSPATHAPPEPQTAPLPYAKPVPGKPGYVFSPFDPKGGYVDVTGYTPGSKVKDPYSGKVFLVP